MKNGLNQLWSSDDRAFGNYASIVGFERRALVTSNAGELVLFDASADKFCELGRCRAFDDDAGVYSHPAFVGRQIYIRGSTHIRCLALERE